MQTITFMYIYFTERQDIETSTSLDGDSDDQPQKKRYRNQKFTTSSEDD